MRSLLNIFLNLTSDLIPFSVPVPAPLPRLPARRRHGHDGQERGHRLGAKPPQVKVPRDGRGGRPPGGWSAGKGPNRRYSHLQVLHNYSLHFLALSYLYKQSLNFLLKFGLGLAM